MTKLKIQKTTLVILSLILTLFFTPTIALASLDECLKYVPMSPILVVVSQNGLKAYSNFLGYGVCDAIPQVKQLIDNYEKKSQVSLLDELAQSNCYVLSLNEVNPSILDFEFLTVMSVNDIDIYNTYIDKWLLAYNAKKTKITKIANYDVYSITSAEIKTPLFYLIDKNIIISSNKLEGLSKALDVKQKKYKNFYYSLNYERIRKKFNIDSNLYIWVSGKFVAEIANMFNTLYPMLSQNVESQKMFQYFTKGLQFIALKKSLNDDNVETEIMIALNEAVSKAIKTHLGFSNEKFKDIYYGIEFNSLKLVPKDCDAISAFHVILPPFNEIINSNLQLLPNVSFKDLNDKLIKKIGLGFDEVLYPWFDDEYTFAKLSNDNGYMLALKFKDKLKLENVLKQVESKFYKNNYTLKTTYYNKFKIKHLSEKVSKKNKKFKISYFIIDNYLVVTNNPNSHKLIINTYNEKEPSIYLNRGFVNTLNYKANDKYKMIGWVNLNVLFNKLSPYLSNYININLSSIDFSKLKLKNIGISNSLTNEGQILKIKCNY